MSDEAENETAGGVEAGPRADGVEARPGAAPEDVGGDAGDTGEPGAPGGSALGEPGGDPGEAEATEAPPLFALLEAVLFAAAEPIPLARLARLLAPAPRAEVGEALRALGASLEEAGRGVRLVEAAGGFQLRSAAECAPWIRRFFAERPPRLSRALLETVAIIAYRQPATRGEIEAIRGVNCDAVLGGLVARGLVQVVGRRLSPGRPVEYGTTAEFLELFSLRDLSALPPLPDPAALANLIEAGESELEADGGDATLGEAAEDLEPGGEGLAPGGGGPDPGGTGPGEREGGAGAGDEGGSDPGPDQR